MAPVPPLGTVTVERVKAPVFDKVPSPESDTNVGTDAELITSSCPPTPVFEVTAPVPAPIKTPFDVRDVVPVPPFDTRIVSPDHVPVVIFPLLMTRPFIVFVEVGPVMAPVALIVPVISSPYVGLIFPIPTLPEMIIPFDGAVLTPP